MSKPVSLRFRQIHLDFHTSEHIPDVAADFRADEFADTLAKAAVNSVTCFARCHHGWMYYDSKLMPHRVHPNLRRRNLLAEQIEACHRRDIRVPIYTTVQWDHQTAHEHADWLVLTEKGEIFGTPPYEAGFYRYLCVNSPYRDFLKEHVREVLRLLPTDGLFLDIVQARPCSCRWCYDGMKNSGMNPSEAADRRVYARQVLGDFEADMTRFIRKYNKDCTIFYNAGHIGPRHRQVAQHYSHFELESLPSGGWGYMHFPVTVRYARNLGPDVMGMTGKFHTSWGDFHSFKNRPALAFECLNMLANTAKCSIGDQLHPSGRICKTTYELVGSVYRDVRDKEPWCQNARALVEIGVLTPEEFTLGHHDNMPNAVFGAVRMLQELRCQFDVIDSLSDFGRYKLIVLPDEIPVSPELAAKLGKYLSAGGAIIASHRAGLAPDGGSFALRQLGVELVGDAPFCPDFIVPDGKGQLPATEHVMYMRGLEVKAGTGAKVLAKAAVPYFNRTWEHFCSHRHTPSSRKKSYPAIVRKGSAIYFAHPVFAQYNQCAPMWCKRLVAEAIEALVGEGMVTAEAPSTLIATLTEQKAQRRRVLHLLHYVPERRGRDFDIIEDEIPLHDVKVSVRTGGRVKTVRCVPGGRALAFELKNGRVNFTVPRVVGHQMIELA
jgi:hypothetical protein